MPPRCATIPPRPSPPAGPTLAYATAKRALAAAPALPLADVLAAEQEDQQRLGLTGDHRDAVAAFLSKQRAPSSGDADHVVRRALT